MDLYNLSPYIRVAMDYTVPPNWILKERVIFDYELLYVKEGGLIVTVENIEYHGIPGDIFLLKPNQKHSMRLVGDVLFRHPHVHFDLYYYPDSPNVKVSLRPLNEITVNEMTWFREDVCSKSPFCIPNHIRLKNPLIVEKMIFDIIQEFDQKPPYYEHSCKGIFTQLWIHLLREFYWIENNHVLSNWEALNEVKLFLSRNLNEDITVDQMAQMANLSKFYFISMFKNAFGTTPSKYHQWLRIEKTKELIQFSSMPLSEIAEMMGFPNIHAFSRSFKKVEGVKPSFYRRKGGNL